MTDRTTAERVHSILRREGRSLYQYLREVPPWVGLRDQHTLARMRECAGAEAEVIEELSKLMQKRHGDYGHLGAFPDFTHYNDAALHFLLPMVIREQKRLLSELEADRKLINEEPTVALLDQLLALKRSHIPILEDLHVPAHSLTTVAC